MHLADATSSHSAEQFSSWREGKHGRHPRIISNYSRTTEPSQEQFIVRLVFLKHLFYTLILCSKSWGNIMNLISLPEICSCEQPINLKGLRNSATQKSNEALSLETALTTDPFSSLTLVTLNFSECYKKGRQKNGTNSPH